MQENNGTGACGIKSGTNIQFIEQGSEGYNDLTLSPDHGLNLGVFVFLFSYRVLSIMLPAPKFDLDFCDEHMGLTRD